MPSYTAKAAKKRRGETTPLGLFKAKCKEIEDVLQEARNDGFLTGGQIRRIRLILDDLEARYETALTKPPAPPSAS